MQELQHQIFRQVYDGRLHLAPVTNPSRVLDIGTGPGTWALVRQITERLP